MTIRTTSGLLALAAAYTLAATAWAESETPAAPKLESKPISGLLAIDFRCKITEGFPNPADDNAFCKPYQSRDFISVSAIGGTLVQNKDCGTNPSYQEAPKFLDGYGIKGANNETCDDTIEQSERLAVNIASSGGGGAQAGFDVNGLWLTDVRPTGGAISVLSA